MVTVAESPAGVSELAAVLSELLATGLSESPAWLPELPASFRSHLSIVSTGVHHAPDLLYSVPRNRLVTAVRSKSSSLCGVSPIACISCWYTMNVPSVVI